MEDQTSLHHVATILPAAGLLCVRFFVSVFKEGKEVARCISADLQPQKKKKIQRILSNVKITFRGESYLFYIIFIGEKQSKQKF